MKIRFLLLPFLLLLCFTSYSQDHDPAMEETLQKWTETEKEENRAKKDDQILIVIVKVKNEEKEAFDKWVKDVLYAALYDSEYLMKKAQLKTVRWMEPVRQNRDETWTYSWIMDPIIPTTDYDIPNFLNHAYGEELGKQHWEEYLTFMAAEPQVHVLRQTDY